MKRLPDFLFLGTAKAGTTSLFYYLLQHPQIYIPDQKEFNFFTDFGLKGDIKNQLHQAFPSIANLEDYAKMFEKAPQSALVGEAATLYLMSEQAPANIHTYIPKAKLIAVLRNPIERSYSNYQYFRRDGIEPLESFEQALDAEPQRKRENWHMSFLYAEMGLYARQLKRYYDIFPAEQIRVYLYEDLKQADIMVKDILLFLGLSGTNNISTTIKVNVSGIPRFKSMHHLIQSNSQIKRTIRTWLPPGIWLALREKYEKRMFVKSHGMNIETKKQLINYYQDDILQLQKIIQRDLTEWLKV